MSILNTDSLVLTGILFEVFGALFLSLESFGINLIQNIFKLFKKYSNWVTSKLMRMLITMPLILLAILFLYTSNRIFFALFIPVIIFTVIESLIVDHTESVEKWIINATLNKKISPIGFVLLLIGNLLQVINYILNMN